MTTLMQDVRYALRQLRRAPGFAVTAVLTLALGIGVTVTVMALVEQVLLAPLPYPEPGRIVAVEFDQPGQAASGSTTGAAGEFVLRHARSFSAAAIVGLLKDANFSMDGRQPSSVPILSVSRGYFDVLGVQPALGRGFSAIEDTPGGPQAVVLSYGFWKTVLGGDAAVVGRVLRLDGAQVTVTGVMPEGFRDEGSGLDGTEHVPAAWQTLQLGPGPGYEYNNYDMIARLRPGVTVAQARGEMAALQPQLYHAEPFYEKAYGDMGMRRTFQVWAYASVVASAVRPSLMVMAWAAAAVLLLACLNLAGLNLSRALHRAPEYSLRVALGAARARLLRLALVEVGLLALGGSVGAVIVARGMLPFLLHNSPVPVPQLSTGAGPGLLLNAALLLGLGCALLFGAPFAFVATWRRGESGGLGQRSASSSRGQVRAGRAIVAGQVALSLVLLSVAALLLGTFLKLKAEPLGFEPQKLVMFQTSLKGDRYAKTRAASAFADAVVAKLRTTPGVSSAAASVGLPLVRGLYDNAWAQGHPDQAPTVQMHTVTPGFFNTVGTSLMAGRAFAAGDSAGAQPVAVMSAAAARKLWPGKPAVGETILVDQKTNAYRVVGVVEDAPAVQLGQPPDLVVYTPMAQQADKMTAVLNGYFPVSFVLRMEAQENASAMARAAVASADPQIPVTGVTTMREVVDESVAAPRFFVQVAEGFAGFAVLLTALGIFGLLSYQVKQRTREIGVRMALGATRGRILRGVLRASAVLCVAGGAAGAMVAVLLHPLLTRWIEVSVAGIDPTQTQYLASGTAGIAAAVGVLCVAGFVAAVLPARRAAKVEPMEALRAE